MKHDETMTIREFKAWLTGLIVGKRGVLPDIEDWKQIKDKLDIVDTEKEVITIPQPYQVDTVKPYIDKWSQPFTSDRPMWNDAFKPSVTYGTTSSSEHISMSNATTSPGAAPVQMDIGLEVQNHITDESLELGKALQNMIAEAENGKKETD